jgi:hypothetical protein
MIMPLKVLDEAGRENNHLLPLAFKKQIVKLKWR